MRAILEVVFDCGSMASAFFPNEESECFKFILHQEEGRQPVTRHVSSHGDLAHQLHAFAQCRQPIIIRLWCMIERHRPFG